MGISYYKQTFARVFSESQELHFVLSGLTLHLASQFGKSSSNHSYGDEKETSRDTHIA